MKKALIITGITLAALVVLVLIVASVALAMVTSSERLTKMVKHYAPQYVNCEMELGKASLTLLKTFPKVGVDIEHVALINPMDGSPSDTLANIDDLTVVLDVKKLLKEKTIVVRQCVLEKAFVNIYNDTEGNSNLNVFNTKEAADSTSFSFDYLVDLEEIKLKNSALFFTQESNQLTLRVKGINLDLKGKFQENDIHAELGMKVDDFYLNNYATPFGLRKVNLGFNGDITQFDQVEGVLSLDTREIQLTPDESLPLDDPLSISLPFQFGIKNLSGHYDNGQVAFKDYRLYVDGDIEIAGNGEIIFDADINSNKIALESLLSYLPEELPKKLNINGSQDVVSLTVANARVAINSSLEPHIQLKIQANDLDVNVSSLTYPLVEARFDVLVAIDLSKITSDSLGVNNLTAKVNHSMLNMNGGVGDLSGDVSLKLNAEGAIPLSDVEVFLPNTMKLKGHTNFSLTTDFTVDKLKKTLEDYNLNRLLARANLKFNGLAFDMDTIHAAMPQLNVNLVLPASLKQKGKTGGYVEVDAKALDAQMGKCLNANMEGAEIRLFADSFDKGLENVKLDATMSFDKLGLIYDTLVADLNRPSINVMTMPERNAKGLNARLTIDGGDAEARLGENYALQTHSLGMKASVQQNVNKTDFLHQWNPAAELTLANAMVRIYRLGEDIHVSNIDFLFDSNLLDFKNCTFRLGQSDLSLQGSVIGIQDWMADHENSVKGVFSLNTELLDVKEIVELIKGLALTLDPKPQKAKSEESDPFLVPAGIDLAIDLNTKETVYDSLIFNDLTGKVTMKDDALILNEMSFTNKAVGMQLSALYQSPHRDSLFFAMDFHMMDMQMKDLLHMIPYFDTLVPMLKTFDGHGEFNIDVETNLWPNYQPKISTLRAAVDIKGKDLTVNDKFTFTKITDMLLVSTNGEYRVDTLDVQLAFFNNKLDIWPSQISIGKYKAIADGFMTIDKLAEYHLASDRITLPVASRTEGIGAVRQRPRKDSFSYQ